MDFLRESEPKTGLSGLKTSRQRVLGSWPSSERLGRLIDPACRSALPRRPPGAVDHRSTVQRKSRPNKTATQPPPTLTPHSIPLLATLAARRRRPSGSSHSGPWPSAPVRNGSTSTSARPPSPLFALPLSPHLFATDRSEQRQVDGPARCTERQS